MSNTARLSCYTLKTSSALSFTDKKFSGNNFFEDNKSIAYFFVYSLLLEKIVVFWTFPSNVAFFFPFANMGRAYSFTCNPSRGGFSIMAVIFCLHISGWSTLLFVACLPFHVLRA